MSKHMLRAVPAAEFIANVDGYIQGVKEAIALVRDHKEGGIGLDEVLEILERKISTEERS